MFGASPASDNLQNLFLDRPATDSGDRFSMGVLAPLARTARRLRLSSTHVISK